MPGETNFEIFLSPGGDIDPAYRYRYELLTFREAAPMVNLAPSYLRLVASQILGNGKQRLKTYPVGSVSFTTRHALHVFAMSRITSGSGSAMNKGLPDEYLYPPYCDHDLAAIEAEIEETRAWVLKVNWRKYHGREVEGQE